jgi:hypothetical protein
MTVVISAKLDCFICHNPIDFDGGQKAIILRHVAYGYGFTHDGVCHAKALDQIFAEPGYDTYAYGHDPVRRRIVGIAPAEGWGAVVPESPERVLAGIPVRYEPLRFWAMVEHRDGTLRTEGVTWDEEWINEAGAAEFPEARTGKGAILGYAEQDDMLNSARLAEWEAMLRSRYRGTQREVKSLLRLPAYSVAA